ncbi:MAG: hypothetical protein KAT69_03565 [Candidatus Aminicenantes bacterium]|nr:hypothetical protein [Candidatus Aminicenantes bacterium]
MKKIMYQVLILPLLFCTVNKQRLEGKFIEDGVEAIINHRATANITVKPNLYIHELNLNSDQIKLKNILEKAAEYCEKVKKVALSFTCTEIIESKKYVYRKGATLIINAFGDIPEVHDFNVRDLKLQKIVKDKFIYEYRLVKKDSTLEENRTLLQKNRRKKYKENAELKIQYKGQFALYGPVGFLSNYWQEYFDYEIVGEELLDEKKTIVVEASPNPANKENRNFAKIWIDEKDFSILQIEWQPQSIADYQRKIQESRRGNLEEKVIWNIKYGVEKNGIKFPSKQLIQRILVDYNWKKKIMEEVSFTYSDYKFFDINSDIKIEPQFLQPSFFVNISLFIKYKTKEAN